MQATDALENLILDHLFRAQSWPKVAALYVALFTSAPTDAAGGLEVSGGGYARVSVPADDAHWVATQGGTSGPSSGMSGTTTNAALILFPAPTGDWGLVTHYGLCDALTGGNLLLWAPLAAPRLLLGGDAAPSFAAGVITVTVGDPAPPTGSGSVAITVPTTTATGLSAIGASGTVTWRAPAIAGTAAVPITATGSVTVSAPGLQGVSTLEDEFVTVLTSTAIGVQNNFNVGDFTALNVLRMNNILPTTITGLTDNGGAPSDGQMVWIVNVGNSRIDIATLHTGSSAANRILTNVAATISLAAGGRALLAYDALFPVWRVLEHEQGAWIDIPYSAGDFTGGPPVSPMIVTAQPPATYRYRLNGRTVQFEFAAFNFSISGTPTSQIMVAMFGGLVPAANQVATPCVTHDNGTLKTGRVMVGTTIQSGTKLVFLVDQAGSNWAASSNATGADCAITFDVQ